MVRKMLQKFLKIKTRLILYAELTDNIFSKVDHGKKHERN